MTSDSIPSPARRGAWGAFAAVAVMALTAWAWRALPFGAAAAQEGRLPSSEGVRPPSAGAAVALARLAPASGLVTVGARPGARVVALEIKEGQDVAAGTVLAILEGHDSARSQVALATAQKRRGEHEQAARLAAARKAAEITKHRLDEGRTLFNQFGATLKGKDRYDAEMALYQLEMQGIKTQLDLALAQGAGASEGGKPPESGPPGGGKPATEILEAQVALAEAAVREAEIRAPGPGRVLRILTHPGETSSGALLVMGDLSSMVARAEVYQTDVPRIHPGDPAEVDILGTRVGGKVERIGAIVGKNQLTSIDPRAMRDLRVVEVTIHLDQPAPANRFVDMEVEAVIRPSGAAGEAGRGPG